MTYDLDADWDLPTQCHLTSVGISVQRSTRLVNDRAVVCDSVLPWNSTGGRFSELIVYGQCHGSVLLHHMASS